MPEMAVLFPSSPDDETVVTPVFETEYSACEGSSFFYPVLFNEYGFFFEGKPLSVSRTAQKKKQDCILRCTVSSWGRDSTLLHGLKRAGFSLALEHVGDTGRPVQAALNHGSKESFLNLDRMAFSEGLSNSNNCWRVFYYEGSPFYFCPMKECQDESASREPPRELFTAVGNRRFDFFSAGIFLNEREEWCVGDFRDGQASIIPERGNAEEFYCEFERVLRKGPFIPEWSWCVVGDIVGSHLIGEQKKRVRGSKHFRPGTKVYIAGMYWRYPFDRCTVLGVPRYSECLVGVVMDSRLIENFRYERVFDEDVLKAIWSNRLDEDFEFDRKPLSAALVAIGGSTRRRRSRLPRRLRDLHPQNADDAVSLGEGGIVLLKEQIPKAITLHLLTRLFPPARQDVGRR